MLGCDVVRVSNHGCFVFADGDLAIVFPGDRGHVGSGEVLKLLFDFDQGRFGELAIGRDLARSRASLRWFDELFTADAWRRSIINSLIIGAGTTALATVLGTVASLGLRGRSVSLLFGFFRTVFLLPMVVPAVVLGVGMQLMLHNTGSRTPIWE